MNLITLEKKNEFEYLAKQGADVLQFLNHEELWLVCEYLDFEIYI